MADPVALMKALARRFEGVYLRPYLCPAGVPTIGCGATFYEDGRRVALKDPPITPVRAEELLDWHVRRVYLPALLKMCPGLDAAGLTGALLDLVFNIGNGNFAASTLRRKVNAGLWAELPAQFMRWNKAGGRELAGLTKRRAAEVAIL